jgi:glucose dehydrogenase
MSPRASRTSDTGKGLWQYRGLPENSPLLGWKCRGVAYYAAKIAGPDCQHRLFLTTAAGQLIAIDADTGRQCSGFANGGTADLKEGMGEMHPDEPLPTSPPTVVNGVIVIGQSISDFGSFDANSGVIRGYDAETGALRWAWDIGRPGQTLLKPGESYTRDTPNAWGVFSGDESLGQVYVGTGNSPPDYFAGLRSQVSDEFTDNVVAIDVATGQLRWSFKTVNHDLWDYDIAAQSDHVLRAFDIGNGREVWSANLPAVGASMPISYVSPRTGRQYIVIAAGGHFAIPGPDASAILAYALPEH